MWKSSFITTVVLLLVSLSIVIVIVHSQGIEEQLKKLKRIFEEKSAEYQRLLKHYNSLKEGVEGLQRTLFSLRVIILILIIGGFLIGFLIGYKYELKRGTN